MVDPDVLGSLDTNGITIVGNNLLDGQVANDDVLDLVDVQANVRQDGAGVLANNGLVRGNADLGAARDGARHNDDSSTVSLSSSSELSKSGDGGSGATSATGSAAVEGSETDVRGVGDGGTLAEGLGGRCQSAHGRDGDGSDGRGLHFGCGGSGACGGTGGGWLVEAREALKREKTGQACTAG